MVKVVDVTAVEKEKAEKRERVSGLIKQVFGKSTTLRFAPGLIIAYDKKRQLVSVWDGYLPHVTVYSPNDFDSAKLLAEEYEREIGKEVELQTDYSEQR